MERLLARLEEDLEGAAAHAVREFGGGGEHHRAVAVVAAGVDSLDRAVIVPEGQGVHVGAKHQDGAGSAPLMTPMTPVFPTSRVTA